MSTVNPHAQFHHHGTRLDLHSPRMRGPRMRGPRLHSPRMHNPRMLSPRMHGPRMHSPNSDEFTGNATGNNDALRFIKRLGAGAYAECWKAEHRGLGHHVAAKVTKCPRGFRKQEIYLLRRAQGEHTVQLIAQEEATPKGTIIVMELCDSSLQDFAQPGDPELFVGYMIQILRGLIHLHDNARIIFGDLKPDNLLVKGGKILFSDFGDGRDCDKDYSRISPHELGWGHPEYHCRPDVNAGVLTYKSDMWMLGQTAVHLWTGQPATRNPSRVPSGIPLHREIQSCLCSDPTQRPTPLQMLREFEQLQEATLHQQALLNANPLDASPMRKSLVVEPPIDEEDEEIYELVRATSSFNDAFKLTSKVLPEEEPEEALPLLRTVSSFNARFSRTFKPLVRWMNLQLAISIHNWRDNTVEATAKQQPASIGGLQAQPLTTATWQHQLSHRDWPPAERGMHGFYARNNFIPEVAFVGMALQHEATLAESKLLDQRTSKLAEQQQQLAELNRRMERKQLELNKARLVHVQNLDRHAMQQQQQVSAIDQRIAAQRDHLEATRATALPDLSLPTTNKIAMQRSTTRKQLLAERKAKLARMGI